MTAFNAFDGGKGSFRATLRADDAHQASLRLDAQFPWLAAAFAGRPTRRCAPDGTRGHLRAS